MQHGREITGYAAARDGGRSGSYTGGQSQGQPTPLLFLTQFKRYLEIIVMVHLFSGDILKPAAVNKINRLLHVLIIIIDTTLLRTILDFVYAFIFSFLWKHTRFVSLLLILIKSYE